MAIRDCDERIFFEGEAIALLQGKPEEIECWVRLVAEKANARLDWHASGYAAQMLHLGDSASRTRVEVALDELRSNLDTEEKRKMDKVFTKRLALNEPGIRRDSVRKVLLSGTRT